QRLADVFDAYLLADHRPGDVGEHRVHLPQHLGEHGGVAHPGVEDAQAWRPGMEVVDFPAHPLGDHRLLGGGVGEEDVGGAGVEKARPGGGHFAAAAAIAAPTMPASLRSLAGTTSQRVWM